MKKLTIKIKNIGPSYIANCSRFDVGAVAFSEKEAIQNICDIIKANSYIYLKRKKAGIKVPKDILEYAKFIDKKKDISSLFNVSTIN